MIVFNFTGLPRAYWLPQFMADTDGYGLWFCSVRWLGCEVIVYSREMATAFIRRLNKKGSV
jgi:hypothetical protein